MKIIDTAIDHRTTVFVFVLLIVFSGTAAYLTVPREAFPEIEIPYIAVTTNYLGVAPSDIETGITIEIEKKLKGLKDVKHVTSASREGSSSILVEFAPNVPSDEALQRVRDKVDEAKPELPDDADDPILSEIDISEFPIMMLNVYGPVSLVQLKEIAEQLEDQIEGVPGVLEADVQGGLERQIRILVDRERLAAYRIPVSRFIAFISAEERNISGGLLDVSDFQLSVRVPGEFKNPLEINTLPIETRDGRPIYLKDVATVVDAFEDRTSIARFDGRPSVSIAVKKRTGENIIRMADGVKRIVAEARPMLPKGVKIATSLDRSQDIRKLVSDLENNIFTGLILVLLVLMVFLGFRTSVIVAMAIPLSMMIAMAVIAMIGIPLNFIVLFSLVLSLGMMVDNSIVIIENIYRHRQEGFGRIEAAKTAASEVAWPIITSTLTTLCAFAPMLFWPGIMGQVMGYLPRTLIITLSAALFVALVINPTIAVVWMPRSLGRGRHRQARTPLLIRIYTPILRAALKVRWATVLVAILALVGSISAFNAFNGQTEFFPSVDPEKASINLTGPMGLRLEASDRLATVAEGVTGGFDNVEHVVVNVGGGAGSSGDMIFAGSAGEHQARVTLDFVDYAVRKTPADETIDALRERLTNFVGAKVEVEKPQEGPPTGAPVNIEISGPDFRKIKEIAAQVSEIAAAVPGVTNLDDDLEEAKPELRIEVDRQRAMMLGLNTAGVAATIKAAISGLEVGSYREGEDEYDIVVRFPERMRRSVEDVEAITIAGPDGSPVPVSAVARFDYVSGLGAINRKDHERVITVSADTLSGYNNRAVLKAVQEALKPVEASLPALTKIEYTGEQEEQEEAQSFLVVAGVVAVLGITLILVTQFNSLALPLVIMCAVILSWIGVFSGLTITGMPFGTVMGGIGVISLAGVVVNNAIVLVDYTQKLRHRGMEVFEAVIKAGQTRVRPVLLTAITTIMGLVPMALGMNFDVRSMALQTRSETSQWWAQMSVVIIFGLAFSTLFTLVVVPVLYTLVEQARLALRRWPAAVTVSPPPLGSPDTRQR